MRTTRLAPSPTGALHLGNARTFLLNWLIARQKGWKIVLRIEDIDGPRIKPGAAQGLIEDLRWLGIDWDEGPLNQLDRRAFYDVALQKLIAGGHAYPCVCSRKEVEAAASAPHAEDGSAVYPGTCRGRFVSIEGAREASGRAPAIRFAAPEGRTIEFDDVFAGHQCFDVARELGDFVIAKADGTPAYQLAVVVDDAAMGVTDVVRGDDLLDSTPRQMLLYEALGLAARRPIYRHVPLVVGTDGRRLAKRHGDTRLAFYRDQGVSAERVLALLARWSGVQVVGDQATAPELIGRFNLQTLSKAHIIFTAADDAWLRSGASPSTQLRTAETA
jgi:glutamyl-tRNA synthetase